jgi:putative transposase
MSIYTARATPASSLHSSISAPCFTPVASPESDGMSGAFVKTLKRDYLRVGPVPGAKTVLDQSAGWFDDYNENHPHSGLRMRSPREFRRAHQPAEVSG